MHEYCVSNLLFDDNHVPQIFIWNKIDILLVAFIKVVHKTITKKKIAYINWKKLNENIGQQGDTQ